MEVSILEEKPDEYYEHSKYFRNKCKVHQYWCRQVPCELVIVEPTPLCHTMPKWMPVDQRLDLIAEAVRYCQKVIELGMPASCYTKALREPIFFLWELRHSKKKFEAARFCSASASGLQAGDGRVVYDHAVPFVYLQCELLNLKVICRSSVEEILNRYGVACLITKEENTKIDQAGLQRSMPKQWDGLDPLARYHAIGIEIVPNPDYRAEGNPQILTA